MKNSSSPSIDVLVVGAGAIGCATAYFLARMGTKVLVLDKNGIGSGTSFHATGLLGAGSSTPLSETAYEATLELVPRLQEETGIDVLYQKQEGLHIALTERQVEQGKAMAAVPGLAGTKRVFLDGDEARKLEPRLSAKILGAVWQENAAQLDSYRYTLALARGAERAGVEFLNRHIVGLVRQGDTVAGVMTPSGAVSADRVVLATGAWSAEAAEWLGMSVPVRPQKGQSIRLRWSGGPLHYLMRQVGWGHLIQRGDGFLSAGSTDEDGKGLDTSPTPEALNKIMEHALSIMPCLETAEMVTQFAGPRPKSVDGLPLMGPVPTMPGAYLNTGHGSSGIFLAAASGRHVAEMVVNGASSVLPEAPYLPARFVGK